MAHFLGNCIRPTTVIVLQITKTLSVGHYLHDALLKGQFFRGRRLHLNHLGSQQTLMPGEAFRLSSFIFSLEGADGLVLDEYGYSCWVEG
jgi:hypothetical protein